MRTPLRLPLPRRPHLILRMPPLAGIRSPASGLRAMKSTNSNRSSSVQSSPAWRMNTAVSATVIGRVRIYAMYANGACFQDGHRGRRLLVHDPCPPRRRGDRLGAVQDGADHPCESGRSGVGRTRNVVAPTSLAGQFEQPYGPLGPPTLFTIPALRYMKTYGLTHEQWAMVSVVQREWGGDQEPARHLQDADHRRGRYPFWKWSAVKAAVLMRNKHPRNCHIRMLYAVRATKQSGPGNMTANSISSRRIAF